MQLVNTRRTIPKAEKADRPTESPKRAVAELLQHASWLRKNGTPQEAIVIARYEEMLQRDLEAKAA